MAAEPLSPTDLIETCLGGIVKALAAQPGLTDEARRDHTGIIKKMILALEPKDATQLMLAGQAMLFMTLTADAATNLQTITDEKLRARLQGQVIALGRLAARHMDRLIRLRDPARRAAAKPAPDPAPQAPPSPPEEAPVTLSRAARRAAAKLWRDRSGANYVPPRTSPRKHKIATERAARLLRAATADPAKAA